MKHHGYNPVKYGFAVNPIKPYSGQPEGRIFMEITIFAKKRTANDGRTFYGYIATLENKRNGEKITAGVKFRDVCGSPKPENCPCNIVVDKGHANLSEKTFTAENGETRIGYTLWVNEWKPGKAYVDTSLDDYE